MFLVNYYIHQNNDLIFSFDAISLFTGFPIDIREIIWRDYDMTPHILNNSRHCFNNIYIIYIMLIMCSQYGVAR